MNDHCQCEKLPEGTGQPEVQLWMATVWQSAWGYEAFLFEFVMPTDGYVKKVLSDIVLPSFIWLVVFRYPVLKNDGVRQLGWLKQPNINGKMPKNGNQTTNQSYYHYESPFITIVSPISEESSTWHPPSPVRIVVKCSPRCFFLATDSATQRAVEWGHGHLIYGIYRSGVLKTIPKIILIYLWQIWCPILLYRLLLYCYCSNISIKQDPTKCISSKHQTSV